MIHQPLTLADIAGPQGPFLIEVLLRDPQAGNPRWIMQQSVRSLEEGLGVASRMCQSYQIRLFLGREYGYLYLDWADDEGAETCSPVWVRKDGAA